MSEAENIPDQLRDLIDDYLGGLLDEGQFVALDQMLRADANARGYFVRYCRLHTNLHLETRSHQAGARALLRIAGGEKKRGIFSRPLLVAAAVLLIAAGALWWTFARQNVPATPTPAEEVAWLVNAQDCRWADGTEPAGTMHAGTVLRVERGLVEVRFRSGARVVLNGPAVLELLSGNSARLLHGRLSARVPEPAIGFELLSPRGKVVDLGTEFGVAVADDGVTDVYVFEGKVVASAPANAAPLTLNKNQVARLDGGKVALRPADPKSEHRFVRAIVPPPAVVPRVLALDFRHPAAGSLQDADGHGIGLTQRLPGTGSQLAVRDENLRLNAGKGQLELTTTNSDVNRQFQLGHGEYLGVRLADLGFTGAEDFAVSVTIPDMPALAFIGQFGLYAGTHSDCNIRGGIFSHRPGQYTQNLVNNNGGRDADSHFVGLFSPGDNLRLTLRRTAGKYALTVENKTSGSTSTLTIRHPAFLDGRRDLTVGLFGANTQSNVRKTLVIREFQVTVWTLTPRK